MRKQVIFDILDDLEMVKRETRFEGTSRFAKKHKKAALEQAIKIVLKHADILDLRPVSKQKR